MDIAGVVTAVSGLDDERAALLRSLDGYGWQVQTNPRAKALLRRLREIELQFAARRPYVMRSFVELRDR